jgi:hypothetical protein
LQILKKPIIIKMNRFKTRLFTALSFLLLGSAPLMASAQEDEKKESTEKQPAFGVSLNGGMTFAYTDVKPSGSSGLIGVGAQYYIMPFLSANLDLQKGGMKAGEEVAASNNEMGFTNSYFYGSLALRFYPVALVNNSNNNQALKILSGIYGGTGLGFLSNSVKANSISDATYGSIPDFKGSNLVVPIQAGITIPVAKVGTMRLDANLDYRVNLCMSDKIDGYVPTVRANEKNDAFNQLTVGLMLNF